MKKILLCLLFSSAFADEPSRSLWDYHPIHVGGNFLQVCDADVRAPSGEERDGTLSFQKENLFLYMLLPISEKSYFFPRVEWTSFQLDWDNNPKFNTTRYYYAQFALTFYTTAIDQWRWILRADYNIDIKHMSRPGMYGLFSAFGWGSYEVHRKWHYHVGVLGYTGMEGQEIYPIIGVDFAPNKQWFFQLVFPMIYSIEYLPFERWRFSIRGRPLKERFRTGQHEPQPRSVFNYSSMGAEFNIHYEIQRRFEFEVFAGYNFGGSFYIKDQYGQNALYTDVLSAPYAGVTLDYAF